MLYLNNLLALISIERLGKIYIPKADVKSVTLVDVQADYRGGEYLGQGVFTTRYQFTTNAFPIKRGENYALINLYGPEVHFGLLPNLSVGIMATWIASPIALALKYTIPTQNPKLNLIAITNPDTAILQIIKPKTRVTI